MIFYFSGTGNSLWVAKELAATYNDKLISISEELMIPNNNFTYNISSDEKIFFVFPVHSWGPAILVFRFLKKINLINYQKQSVFLICTCGDNCGYTTKIVERILDKKSILLTKGYSIQMPNNYVLMKGFSTDTKEIETQKLNNAPNSFKKIIEDIQDNKKTDLYTTGTHPFLKSFLVYPLFRKFAIKRNSFYAKNICTACGTCIDICPTKTIFWKDNKLKWNNTCIQCTACINRCPVEAIEYGKVSQGKGRYYHPDL